MKHLCFMLFSRFFKNFQVGLKNNIWANTDEIPNNKKDDDNNDYIDDINGWNFLGNTNGDNTKFVNYEYTRILKKYDGLFNPTWLNLMQSH